MVASVTIPLGYPPQLLRLRDGASWQIRLRRDPMARSLPGGTRPDLADRGRIDPARRRRFASELRTEWRAPAAMAANGTTPPAASEGTLFTPTTSPAQTASPTSPAHAGASMTRCTSADPVSSTPAQLQPQSRSGSSTRAHPALDSIIPKIICILSALRPTSWCSRYPGMNEILDQPQRLLASVMAHAPPHQTPPSPSLSLSRRYSSTPSW